MLANQHTFLGPDKMSPVDAEYACWAEYGDAIIIARSQAGVDGYYTTFSMVKPGGTPSIVKLGDAGYAGSPRGSG